MRTAADSEAPSHLISAGEAKFLVAGVGGKKFLSPSWDEIYDLSVKLARKIKERGIKIDTIIAVARGGLVPARIISDLLDVMDIEMVQCVFYKDIESRAEEPMILRPVSSNLKGKSVLVVDDVADTGGTLNKIIEHVKEAGASSVYVATLYVKPWNKADVDFSIVETDAWIVFPWERAETIRKFVQRGEAVPSEALDKSFLELLKDFTSQ